MPYKHREPVPVEEMLRDRYAGHHSVCQTLRDIYHLADSLDSDKRVVEDSGDGCDMGEQCDIEYNLAIDTIKKKMEELKVKCRLAMAMAKAMNEKLKYYKAKELASIPITTEGNSDAHISDGAVSKK